MQSFTRTMARCVPFVILIAACSVASDNADPGGVPSGNPNGADNGGACGGGNDCKSGVCTASLCAVPTHSDGVRNGTETGLDCGGADAPKCGGGQACNVAGDCASAQCDAMVCGGPAEVVPSHNDGVKNLDETDVDCGGPTAPKCGTGKACGGPKDCDKNTCLMNVCKDPTVTDGVKNGDETDVDCGGGTAPACKPGLVCAAATDCDSKICGTDKKCTTPTKTDGVQNGDESDVDCGGTSTGAPGCILGKSCVAHADCASDACDYKKKCIAVKSCTPQHGGDTCGPGEVAAGHESCCTTIAGSVVDKYNITAGRMRAFVERTNGNMRAFATTYTGAWWSHTWDQYLPTMLDSGGTDPDFTGVYQELGPIVHPPGATGANEGCYVDGYGARTYRIPDAVNQRMMDNQHYTQDVLDEKALNCVDAYIIAAFCAWDGGRMPTRAEWNAAWGAGTYPWSATAAGNTPPGGWPQAFDSDATGSPVTPANGDPKLANFTYNYWGPPNKVAHDYSLYIAPPGRFPKGNGPMGHADLAASVFNFEQITGNQVNWSKSGSWQGHGVPYPDLSTAATNKYWATGGRCARD